MSSKETVPCRARITPCNTIGLVFYAVMEVSVPKIKTAMGLMSGTSMDGIDAAMIETDGEARIMFGQTTYRPYTDAERVILRDAVEAVRWLHDRDARPGILADAEQLVTTAHMEAVEALLARTGEQQGAVDVIGFHGQTVLHRPEDHLTIQIGDGLQLARAFRRTVVHDLRARDVAAGGQGAPLVPIYHAALVRNAELDEPVAVANLGGVGNVTVVEGDMVTAFDTGPANAMVDDLVQDRLGLPFDEDGAIAAAGRIDQDALERLLDHPYFAMPAPKSLDRNAFSADPVRALSIEDAAATLLAFSARTMGEALAPYDVKRLIATGGGTRNPTLLSMLRAELPCPVETGADHGWRSDFIEAQAFAYLAVRRLRELPGTFPSTTGAPEPLLAGEIAVP